MASVSASPSPRREVKCAKSSPTDSVAEVNTQAARVPPVICAKRAATSKGNRLRVKPRCVSSTLRAPSCSSACMTASRRAGEFGGARRALRDAGLAAVLVERRRQRRAATRDRSCAASASGVSAASQSGRGVPRRISASAASAFSTAPNSTAERRWPARDLREFLARVAQQQLDLAAAETRAEELRGEIRDLVRLVEDHRVRRAEQVAEAVFLERQIRQQQVVIDDDDVGFDGLAARLDHVTAADVGAAGAETVVARRGDLRPQRMRVAQVRHFGEVAALRDAGPALARAPACGRACPRRLLLAAELLQAVGAQIVRAPLEQRDARRHADGARHQRQVLVEQLVLQRARAGGDEHALAGQQRRHQVGEGLAGAGAGLDHERRAVFERQRHAPGHRQLRTARREARQRTRQRAARSEYLVE